MKIKRKDGNFKTLESNQFWFDQITLKARSAVGTENRA